jgi:hypothetical protein
MTQHGIDKTENGAIKEFYQGFSDKLALSRLEIEMSVAVIIFID